MGLLDDAIREHLDLKRRRGADPAEVERAEREALGPVRRNRDPGDAADPEDQAPAAGFAYDHEDDQDWHEPAASGPEFADLHGEFDEFEDDEPDLAPPSGSAEGGPARPRSLGGPHDYKTSAPDDYAPPDPGGYAASAPGDYAGSDPGGYEPPDPDDYESP